MQRCKAEETNRVSGKHVNFMHHNIQHFTFVMQLSLKRFNCIERCWNNDPERRPLFVELVTSLHNLLHGSVID